MNSKIITKLPTMNGKGANKDKIVTNCKAMVGMTIDIIYNYKKYKVKILKYYISDKKKRMFKTKCNDVIYNIKCGDFIACQFKNVVGYKNLNKYRMSEDKTYWIGILDNNKEFYFDGEKSNEIMKMKWYYKKGYVMNNNHEYLHKFIFGNVNIDNVIDHINNNTLDNRIKNLREVSKKQNSKNKNTKNKNGLTSLNNHGNKYWSTFHTDYGIINTKYKDYEDAYIDNLIAQRYLNYNHNEDKFYLLNNLPINRIKEVEDLIDYKINKNKLKVKHEKNYNYKMEISNDYTYYTIWDSKNRTFLISNDEISLNILKKYKWTCYTDKSGKTYVVNGKYRFHRIILGLLGDKYSKYIVDHLNGCGTDNRFDNLIITNHYGNCCNIKGKGYTKTKYNTYQVSYMKDYPNFKNEIGGNRYKIVKTEQEAIEEVKRRKEIIMKNRLKFKTKEELDKYIENSCKCGNSSDVIKL